MIKNGLYIRDIFSGLEFLFKKRYSVKIMKGKYMLLPMKKPELLLPAGSLDRLKTAFLYGADAVYAGMPAVSLRNKTSFSLEEMKVGIEYAHEKGKKVYLTVNLFTHNADLPRLEGFVEHLKELQPDGVIVADPGVFRLIQSRLRGLPIHISTQANVCSSLTVRFWKDQGASCCVLGREVPLSEVKQIRTDCPDIRLEMFIHGALCVSYSGRCLLSNFMTGRSANKGNCAHACRWKYRVYQGNSNTEDPVYYLEEETRDGALMRIDEDEHGTYIMNSRDLCLMPRLNDILSVGLDLLKIEGRNKSEYYTAITARAYRHAIDAWFENPDSWKADLFLDELATLQSRGYTVGFLDGNAGPEAHNYNLSASTGAWRYAGIARHVSQDGVLVEVKHKMTRGMLLEIVSPNQFEPIRFVVDTLYDPNTKQGVEAISSGRLGQLVGISLPTEIARKITPLTVFRIKITE